MGRLGLCLTFGLELVSFRHARRPTLLTSCGEHTRAFGRWFSVGSLCFHVVLLRAIIPCSLIFSVSYWEQNIPGKCTGEAVIHGSNSSFLSPFGRFVASTHTVCVPPLLLEKEVGERI